MELKKTFLRYPSLPYLGQRVSSIRIIIVEDKILAILDLAFPATLKDLEYYLSLTR